MKRLSLFLCAATLAAATAAPAFADDVLFEHAPDVAHGYPGQDSENSIGQGAIYQKLDDFTLSFNATITSIDWVGLHVAQVSGGTLSGFASPINSFYVEIFEGNPLTPGSPETTLFVDGSANESFVDSTGSYYVESYSAAVNFTATAGTQYWLDIFANTDTLGTWAWANGTGGNGIGLDDYDGTIQSSGDSAFTLNGFYASPVIPPPSAATPEPSSLFLIGSGMLTMAGMVRKRLAQR